MAIRSNFLTKFVVLVILTVIGFTIYTQKKWDVNDRVINSDVRGYYAYLPALFVNDDIQLNNLEPYVAGQGHKIWFSTNDEGQNYIKYTCGLAILYSPFFAIAHQTASSLDAPADGFSWPYKVALLFSAWFYCLIGLIFMSKLLLKFFSDRVVATTLLILFFGTNLYVYETGSATLSHSYSFSMIALFLYASITWLESNKWKWALWMGLSAGMMSLIRPIDFLFVLIPLLYQVNSKVDLKARLQLIVSRKAHILIAILAGLLVIFPQLLYYKTVFGSFFAYSYSDEGFFFLQPHLFDTLFSYRNGWLIYTPIMMLSLIGLWFIRNNKDWRSAVYTVGVLYFFVIASWWCWWYVGFGNRAFINLYPLLSIPLAVLLTKLFTSRWYTRTAMYGFILFAVAFNFLQSYQFDKEILHWGSMSKKAYWNVFGKAHYRQMHDLYLEHPDYEAAKRGENKLMQLKTDTLGIWVNSFENGAQLDTQVQSNLLPSHGLVGSTALRVPSGSEFALERVVELPEDVNFVYLSAWFKNSTNVKFFLVDNQNNGFSRFSSEVSEQRGEWKKVHLLAELPSEVPLEHVRCYLWNETKTEFLVDDFEIVLLNIHQEHQP